MTTPLIGAVLVAHGALAHALEDAVRSIIPGIVGLASVDINSDAPPEQNRQAIAAAVAAVDQGHGVLLLTDVYGATPANLCLSLYQPQTVEILSGVNLPMLLKLFGSWQQQPLAAVLHELREYGKKTIVIASELAAHRHV